MATLLNMSLYRALCSQYPDVSVQSPGVMGDYIREVETVDRDGRSFRRVRYVVKPGGDYGERYRFNCPFCGDTKKRFYVSHLFGVRDAETGVLNYRNVHCFNDDGCHTDFDNLRELMETVELAELSQPVSVDSETLVFSDSTSLLTGFEVGMPGDCFTLDSGDKPAEYWDYYRYLSEVRNYDVAKLERFYGVRYLHRSFRYRYLAGRAWVPFYREGRLAAWTARAVPGLCDEEIKYATSPGGLGGLLYGLNGAVAGGIVTLVEGPADKWVVGHSGVSLLCKSLGAQKLQRLVSAISAGGVGLVLVMLDPEQPDKEKAAGRPHQIVQACEILSKYWSGLIVPIYLAHGKDPGGSQGISIVKQVQGELNARGLSQYSELFARQLYGGTVRWE